MSYLRYVLFVFTSMCLQEDACLIYVMFCSSLLPCVCRTAHVLFTLCSVRLYLHLFVGGLMSYLRYVLFVFTSSCLQEGSCLIYGMFCSSLPPVVCRRAHVLFTLFAFVCTQWCPTHIMLCFCFVFLRFVYPILPVSLVCHFLSVNSVLYNVYLFSIENSTYKNLEIERERYTAMVFNVTLNNI